MKNLLKKRINTFEAINQNKFLLTNSVLIKQEFTNALLQKDVLISTLNLSKANNSLTLSINGFTRTSKLLKYRKLMSKKPSITKIKKETTLNKLFTGGFHNRLANDNVIIKYKSLNQLIDKKLLTKNFKMFRKFSTVLFSRGFNLFLDFLKIITLVEQRLVNPKTFLLILGQVFRNSNKKKHTKFVFFIKTIFDTLINTETSNILGLKFIINGKIMGKTRASTVKIEKGALSLNTINSECLATQMHVYTLYGAFGFKLWINYKN